MLRSEDILAQFDAVHADLVFPDLDDPYVYAIDCRLHAFADPWKPPARRWSRGTPRRGDPGPARRWALVVETLGYSPRAGNLYDTLHYFGNCLAVGDPGAIVGDFLARIENMGEVEDEEPGRFAGHAGIEVRGRRLAVDAVRGDHLSVVFRTLVPEHRDLLLATDPEIRRRLPDDIAKILQLEEWHQPDLAAQRPSRTTTYRQLAAVLAAGDPTLYRPTQPPNTHWGHWPGSGSL